MRQVRCGLPIMLSAVLDCSPAVDAARMRLMCLRRCAMRCHAVPKHLHSPAAVACSAIRPKQGNNCTGSAAFSHLLEGCFSQLLASIFPAVQASCRWRLCPSAATAASATASCPAAAWVRGTRWVLPGRRRVLYVHSGLVHAARLHPGMLALLQLVSPIGYNMSCTHCPPCCRRRGSAARAWHAPSSCAAAWCSSGGGRGVRTQFLPVLLMLLMLLVLLTAAAGLAGADPRALQLLFPSSPAS